MKIIGLSGGVASGKNFISEIFAKNGAAVFDADKEVHNLLKSDSQSIFEIKNHFPESFVNNSIDRKILGKIVFGDTKKLDILEAILHPKIRHSYKNFLKEAHKQNRKFVLLNIPLLLEKEGYKCNKIIAILIPEKIQKQRFLQRYKKLNSNDFAKNLPQIEQRFYQIKSNQLNNLQRKKKADFVIFNGLSKAYSLQQVKKICSKMGIC